VAAGGLVDGDAAVGERLAEPLDLLDALGDVGRVDGLPEADSERREVAARHAAVRGEPLVEDAALAALLVQLAVAPRRPTKPPMLTRPSFFPLITQASA